MEHFERLDVLRKRGFLSYDSLEFLVLLFDGSDSVLVLFEELLCFLFDAFCKSGDLLVLDNYLIVEVGPELILSLVVLVPEFLHFVLE